jgi:hypothetical protein
MESFRYHPNLFVTKLPVRKLMSLTSGFERECIMRSRAQVRGQWILSKAMSGGSYISPATAAD